MSASNFREGEGDTRCYGRETELSTLLAETIRSWLAVTKKRQLRKFGVTPTRALAGKEVAASERVPIGCAVELTRLDYATDGTTEWTFGLEAFGPTSQLLDVMQVTVRAISPGVPDLPAEWTASYATWMLRKSPITKALDRGQTVGQDSLNTKGGRAICGSIGTVQR